MKWNNFNNDVINKGRTMGHVGNTSAPLGKLSETYPSTRHFQKECMP
jgi:hypothetical protein